MRRRKSFIPDMTPLVDIVFLLLIFFLVASIFKKDELALFLSLPSAKEGETALGKEKIVIELSKENVAFNGRVTGLEGLSKKLSKIKDRKRTLMIRIDRHVPYSRVIELFNLLKKYNFDNFLLIEERKTE